MIAALLGGKITKWAIIGSLFIGSFLAWGAWNRYDAAVKLRAELEALQAKDRLQHIEEDRRLDREIDNLDPDGLRERAAEWVFPAGPQ